MAQKGWIKLHRKIRDNPIFNEPQLLRLWLICLTEATHKERDQIIGKQTVHLMPGEFVTGRFDIQELYNRGLRNKDKVSGEKTVYRWLEALENGGFLTIKKTTKYSIVSIDKWDFYQGSDQDNDQQMTTNKNDKEEIYVEIVSYLNEKVGTNFNHKTKGTVEFINGRLKDGRTVEDFKKVIDVKSDEWLGTDREQFLRPSTLFRPSNFENYLNQANRKKKGSKVPELDLFTPSQEDVNFLNDIYKRRSETGGE